MPQSDTSWNPYCNPPPPPCKPECCVCDSNTGRDVEFAEWRMLLPYVQSATTYLTKTGDRMSAPPNAILQAIRETAISFAEQTRVLRRTFKAKTQKGVRDYYIETLPNERISLVNRVCVDGNCLEASDLHCCNGCCVGDGFVFEPGNKLVLDCSPCEDSHCHNIEVTYHAAPTEDACVFDKLLLDRYRQAIQYGALENLLTMPGYEWTRPDYGVNYGRKYQSAIAGTKIDVSHSFASGKRFIESNMRF